MKLKEVISKLFPLLASCNRKTWEAKGDRRTGRKLNTISCPIMDLECVTWTLGPCYLFNTQRTMSPFQESGKIPSDSLFASKRNVRATELNLQITVAHKLINVLQK